MKYYLQLYILIVLFQFPINSFSQKNKIVISNPNYSDILEIGNKRVEELSRLGYRIKEIKVNYDPFNSFKIYDSYLKYNRGVSNHDTIFVETIVISNQRVNIYDEIHEDFFSLTKYSTDNKVQNKLVLGPLNLDSYKNQKGFKIHQFKTYYPINENYNYQSYLNIKFNQILTGVKILLKNETENRIESIDNKNPNRLNIINENYNYLFFSILYENNYRLIKEK